MGSSSCSSRQVASGRAYACMVLMLRVIKYGIKACESRKLETSEQANERTNE